MLKRLPLFLVCLFLAACGTLEVSVYQTPTADAAPRATLDALQAQNDALVATVTSLDPATLSINLDSPSDVIRLKMLNSHTFWRSIFVDGTATWNISQTGGQPAQSSHEQLRIDQSIPAFWRIGGPASGQPEYFSVSDGQNILQMNLITGMSESRPLPEFARRISEYAPLPIISDTVTPHPLSGTIGSPLSEVIFSSGFAQTAGTFKPIGIENIAGRQCLIVDFTRLDQPSLSRFWVDMGTGIVLKYQDFDVTNMALRNEIVISFVEIDSAPPENIFSLDLSALPQYAVVSGVTPAPTPIPASPAGVDDPLGQVYFSITDHKYGEESYKLVRLPGSCVAGLTTCPEFETLPFPVAAPPDILQLYWSPDGSTAALVSATGPGAAPTGLYLLDPGTFSTRKLTEFPFIDPPAWSPDGNWLAFRTQDGNGGVEIYAIRSDGSSLTKLTENPGLPPEGRPYLLNGWLGEDVLLHASGQDGGYYHYSIATGNVSRLLQDISGEQDMIPAPNGALMAYLETTENKTALKLTTPDGENTRDLATFSQSVISPIIWSPDSTKIAFVQGNVDLTGGQAIYIINRTGENFRKVMQSIYGSISSVTFSPDGGYLLVQDDDAIGRHLFIVNLTTLEQRKLYAPGLPLDWWWLAPSWQP
jgi:WD40 repeat protein